MRRLGFLALVASLVMFASSPVFAQLGGGGGGPQQGAGIGGGGGGQGGGGQGGGGQGGGGQGGGGQGGNVNVGVQTGGVFIDADGIVQLKTFPDPGWRLTTQKIQAQLAKLDPDVAKPSELRKISLNRLDAAIRAKIEAGEQPDEVMQCLAGLKRIQYVFYYPETKDIVIAGPAEPWVEDLGGRVLGINSSDPILLLEDLAVALRTFSPNNRENPVVGCSIDPTQEGLARMQGFLRQWGRQALPNQTAMLVQGLQQSLGDQVVSVLGVSPTTHMAKVMVEADYRMKLIGINLEYVPGVNMKSYVDRATPAMVRGNAMARWYFVPEYACVRGAEDGTAMELVGDGVKLVGEEELVANDGNRRARPRVSRASKLWVQDFTKNYSDLTYPLPVYGQLRNCIDLLVAAAFIKQHDYYGQADWQPTALLNEQMLSVEKHNTPKEVATAVNAIWKNNTLMTPIGGGVQIQPTQALNTENLLQDEDGTVAATRKEIYTANLPPNQWWWD